MKSNNQVYPSHYANACTLNVIPAKRRALRIILIVLLIFIVSTVILVYEFCFQSSDAYTLSSSLQLVVHQSNCRMYFKQNKLSADSVMQIKLHGPIGTIFKSINSSTASITTINSYNTTNACWIQIESSENTTFSGGLSYLCDNECSISSNDTLEFGTSNVDIRGESLSVNLQQVNANAMNIYTQKGDVYINAAKVTAANITSLYGNIAYQSAYSYSIQITSMSKYYCLSAKSYKLVSDTCDASNQVPPCIIVLTLCNTIVCTPLVAPAVYLYGGNGNVWANTINNDFSSESSNQIYTLQKSRLQLDEYAYNSGYYSFDSSSLKSIESVFKGYNATEKYDSVMILRYGSFNSYAVCPNSAYLDMSPWLASFLSLKLLVGHVADIAINLLPGICPYVPNMAVKDAYRVQKYISDWLGTQQRKGDDVGIISNGKISTVAYMDGAYLTKEREYTITLIAAITISIILSVCAGAIAIYLAIHGIIALALSTSSKPYHASSILSCMPSIFEVVDHIGYAIRRTVANSLEEFTELLFIKADSYPNHIKCRMSQIQSLYENYCHINSYTEHDITSKWEQLIKKKGYSIIKVKDTDTMAYSRVVFTCSEIPSATSNHTQNSLQLFIQSMCRTTQFKQDCIDCNEFNDTYHKYCQTNELLPVEITRTKIQQLLKIDYQPIEVAYVARDSTQCPKYNIDVDIINSYLSSTNARIFNRWYVHDTVSVLMHFLVVTILCSTPFVVSYFYEIIKGQYSVADSRFANNFIHWSEDTATAISNISLSSNLTIALGIIGAIFYVITILHIVAHYCRGSFTKLQLNHDSTHLAYLIGQIEWIYFLISFGLLIGYIFLILQWNILGALLNPSAYLVYATSASSFIVFILAKYRSFKKLQSLAMSCLKDIIANNTSKLITSLISKYVTYYDDKQDGAYSESSLEQIIESTSVGKNAVLYGYDIASIIAVFQDSKSIELLCSKHGLPIQLIGAFKSMIEDDVLTLKDSIISLTSEAPYNFPDSLMKCILKLVLNQDDSTKSYVISDLSIAFIEHILQDSKISPQRRNKIVMIFPQIMIALRHFISYDIESFFGQVKLINQSVLNDGAYQSECYALPPIVFDLIEISKLLASSSNGVSCMVHFLKPSLLSLLKYASQVEQCIIDLISLSLGSSVKMRQMQNNVIKGMLSKYGIPSFNVGMFIRIVTNDNTINNELISNISMYIKTKIPFFSSISPQFVSNVFKLRILLTNPNPYFTLKSQANRLYQPMIKNVLAVLMESTSCNEGIGCLLNSPVIDLLYGEYGIPEHYIIGYASLLTGSYRIPHVKKFIQEICEELPLGYADAIYAIIVLVVSQNPSDLMNSLSTLNIDMHEWLLVGKHLLNAGNMSAGSFERVAISADHKIYKDSKECTAEKGQKQWISSVLHYISQSYAKPDKKYDTIDDHGIKEDAIIENRKLASLLISISNADLTTDGVHSLLACFYNHSQSNALQSSYVNIAHTIVSIVELIKPHPNSNREDIISSFSKVIKVDHQIVLLITNIVLSDNYKDIALYDTQLCKLLNHQKEKNENSFIDYTISSKNLIYSIKQAQESIQFFAEVVAVPAFIFRSCIIEYDTALMWNPNEIIKCLLVMEGTNPNFRPPNNMLLDDFNISFASLLLGNPISIHQALDFFGISYDYTGLIKAILQSNVRLKYRKLLEESHEFMLRIKQTSNTYKRLINTIAFKSVHGYANSLYWISKSKQKQCISYMSKQIKETEGVVSMIDSKISRDQRRILKSICNYYKHDGVPEYIYKGIYSLLQGSYKTHENFAGALKLEDDRILETLLSLSKLYKAEDKNIIDIIRNKSSFKHFCDQIGINPAILHILVGLSLNFISNSQIENAIKAIKLETSVCISFVKALLGIAKSYNNILQAGNRVKNIENLKRKCLPLIFSLGMSPELSLIAIRLRQGDFLIINDFQNYVSPILSTSTVRNVAMGISGMLTNPINFESSPLNLHGKLSVKSNFEGANHLLCNTLHLNPLVCRLVCFDSKLCELKSGISDMMMTALVASLGMPDNDSIMFWVCRSFRRSLLIKKQAIAKSVEEKLSKTTIKKLQEQYNKNCYDMLSLKYATIGLDSINTVNNIYECLQHGGVIEPIEATDISAEIAWFNNPNWMAFKYDSITKNKKRHFNFTDEEINKITKGKQYFDTTVQQKLHKKNNDDSNTTATSYEGISLGNSWLNKEHRDKCRNVWFMFNYKLRMNFLEYNDYDRITISQFYFYICLISIKYKIQSPNFNPQNHKQYCEIISDIEIMMLALETIAFINGSFDLSYDRMSVIKIISLSVGFKLSNAIDYRIIPSLYSTKYYYPLKDEEILASTQSVQSALAYLESCNHLFDDLLPIERTIEFSQVAANLDGKLYDHYERYRHCNPYDIEEVLKWNDLPTFDYHPSSSPLFSFSDNTDFKESICSKLCIMCKKYHSLESYASGYETDDNMKKSHQCAYNLMSVFEEYTSVEDGVEFVLWLSTCNQKAFDKYKSILTKIGVIKSSHSTSIYSDLFSIMCIRRKYYDYTKSKATYDSNYTYSIGLSKDMESYAEKLMKIDAKIVCELILVAHGIDIEHHIECLCNKLKVKRATLSSIFLEKANEQEQHAKVAMLANEIASNEGHSIDANTIKLMIAMQNDSIDIAKIDSLPIKKENQELLTTCNDKTSSPAELIISDIITCDSDYSHLALLKDITQTNCAELIYNLIFFSTSHLKLVKAQHEQYFTKLLTFLRNGIFIDCDAKLVLNFISLLSAYRVIEFKQRVPFDNLQYIYPMAACVLSSLKAIGTASFNNFHRMAISLFMFESYIQDKIDFNATARKTFRKQPVPAGTNINEEYLALYLNAKLNELNCSSEQYASFTNIATSILYNDFNMFSQEVSQHNQFESFNLIQSLLLSLLGINQSEAVALEKSLAEPNQIAKCITCVSQAIVKLSEGQSNALLTKHPSIISDIMILLISLRHGTHYKKCYRETCSSIVKAFTSVLKDNSQNITQLLIGIIGNSAVNDTTEDTPFNERIKIMHGAIADIYFGDLKERKPVIVQYFETIMLYLKNEISLSNNNAFTEGISSIFGQDPLIIKGVIGIITHNMELVSKFLSPVNKIEKYQLQFIYDLMKITHQTMHSYNRDEEHKQRTKTYSDTIKEAAKKLREGTAGIREIYNIICAESGNTGIAKQELRILLNRMNTNTTHQKINQIFELSKTSSVLPDRLDYEELKNSIDIVYNRNVYVGIDMLNLSTSKLVIYFIIVILILSLLLIFILLGINSFTPGGVFASVINGAMPIIAAVGIGRGSSKYTDEELKKKINAIIIGMQAVFGKE